MKIHNGIKKSQNTAPHLEYIWPITHIIYMKINSVIIIAAIIAVFLVIPRGFSGYPDDRRGESVDNFGKINDNYYRGGQPQARHFPALKEMGIRTIVNLRKDGPKEEESLAKQAGMNYFYLPLSSRRPATQTEVDEFLKIVDDPENWPVYVHCAAGKHRTGGMTAVYRMTNDGWTADMAFAEMKKYGFYSFLTHGSWKKFVYKYYLDMSRKTEAPAQAVPRQQLQSGTTP